MTTTKPTSETRLLTEKPAWKALGEHYRKIRNVHLRSLFADDPRRGERMTAEGAGLYLDYSKNRITDETIGLLLNLAEECGLRRAHRGHVPGPRRSTSRRIGPFFTSPCVRLRASRFSLTASMSCPRCTPYSTGWPFSRSRFAAASGGDTPESASATSLTSASAAPILARSWPTRR